MNDLSLILNCATIAMYADDSTVYTSAHRPAELRRVLNEELKLIEEWVPVNKLVLNIEETKCMVLGSKHSSKVTAILHLTIGDIDIKQVTEAKLLGISVDSTYKSKCNE